MTTLDALKARFRLDDYHPASLMISASIIAAAVLDELDGRSPLDCPELPEMISRHVVGVDIEVAEVMTCNEDIVASLAGGTYTMIMCIGTEVKQTATAPIVAG